MLIGDRIRAWERGRRDRLASRFRHAGAIGNAGEWYRSGYHYTQRQLERGEILQLALDLDGTGGVSSE